MRVAITGASGLIGSALCAALAAERHDAHPIRRKGDGWCLDRETLEGCDAVVHLAGESINALRWTEEKKRRIRESRVNGTTALIEELGRLSRPPASFLCASAVGFYGERGQELLNESSPAGTGFLASVCREWEEASRAALSFADRVINPRFGIVFSARGGALPKMLLPFRLGLAVLPCRKEQFLSWISLADAVKGLIHCLSTGELRGPINITSPDPVLASQFVSVFGRELHAPLKLKAPPANLIQLLFGEMGQELLLTSTRAAPDRLLQSGFRFQHPTLEQFAENLPGS